MKRLRRVLTVMRLEALHMRRDRTTRSLLLVVPVLQLLLFGYAVNLDPRDVPVAIAAGAMDALTPIERTNHFRVVSADLAPGAAERQVEHGEALVGIERGAGGRVRVIVDATDPSAVRPALAALERTLHGSLDRQVDVEWRYNPEQRTAWSIVPGLAGAVVMISMLMLGALTLVRERERGTWEALLATPVGMLEALAGKLAPYLPIGVAQTALVVLCAALLFELPVRGTLGGLLLAAALSAASYLAIGFAISAHTRTQMQAIQLAVMLYLPSMLLSGFMFPFQGMPGWAQAIGEALPLTHFVRVSRDVLLRGGTDGRLAGELGWLAAIAAVCIAVAAATYRRRLD